MGSVTRMAESTPVTVLTGAVGAGKTTLLDRLLRHPDLARAAVLLTGSGGTALDHRLVERVNNANLSLNAGCVCCGVRGDLARVLRKWLPLARRDEISRVFIEADGREDPLPILATLLTDMVAAAAYRLDGIVTVVDAVAGHGQLDTGFAAERHIAVADRIVLGKADLTDTDALLGRIRQLNPQAPVATAVHGNVPPDFVLGAGGFDPITQESWEEDRTGHGQTINTFSLMFDSPLIRHDVARWLERLTGQHGSRLLRIKGILDLSGETRPVVIQGVGHLLSPPAYLPAWSVNGGKRSRLLFVTRGLPKGAVTDGIIGFVSRPYGEVAAAWP
jgi:G3E family GTPase